MKPVNGSDLVRRLNQAVNDAVCEWQLEQDWDVKSDGALCTVTERMDLNRGFEVTIRYPFVIGGLKT